MSIENGVLLQYFHWHLKNDGTLWREVAANARDLARVGITSVWLPPAFKGTAGTSDVGYGVYDIYDLGEFDSKGAVRTKYGSKHEYIYAVRAIQDAGMGVYADIVLNHRCGADATEIVKVTEVDNSDRNKVRPESACDAEVWTKFDFAARAGKYSTFTFDHRHFTAVDHKVEGDEPNKIYLLDGKNFSGDVSHEKGNFDYLMGCDVDMYNPEVIKELREWAKWYVDTTGVDGFRLDAVKHIPVTFYRDYMNYLKTHFGDRELLTIGEHWTRELDELRAYIHETEGHIKLFDVPLHHKLCAASKAGNGFDLSKIFEGTLVDADPLMAVTFVDNHDTQPGQSLESWVDDWFKPSAYALTLLRQGGYPTVFYGDYYGSSEANHKLTSHRKTIEAMLEVRRKYNFGDQHDYFDHPNCIAWVRSGNPEHPGALVVVLTNGDAGFKHVETFANNKKFFNVLNPADDAITTDEKGEADFNCPPGGVSVWVQV